MAEELDVAIVGAGPYGLAIAAHLAHRRVAAFGSPLLTWRTRMPADMELRAAWHEMTLTTPSGAGTLDDWMRSTGARRVEPMPVADFIRYADWYRERFVPEVVESDVASLEEWRDRLLVRTAAGEERVARHAVAALGITPFPYVPAIFRDANPERVTVAVDRTAWAATKGRRIAIVGGGQTAVEAAAIAASTDADVELLVRGSLVWFADREPYHPRGRVADALYRLAYPAVGYGPPPINRLVLHPDLFAALPAPLRRRLTARMLKPGGSPWLRARVEGKVRVTQHVSVVGLDESNRGVVLRLDDGSQREVDEVVLGTGYRFDLDRLAFLDPRIRQKIEVSAGWPSLDRAFRSTDPRILFVGYAAEGHFGAIGRFVLGVPFTARRVATVLG